MKGSSGSSGMCVEIFRRDAFYLLQLLNEKDIKIKVSQYEADIGGYKQSSEQATLDFLCNNFNPCSKVIHDHINEDNIYEIEFFRLEGGKWCFGIKYKM